MLVRPSTVIMLLVSAGRSEINQSYWHLWGKDHADFALGVGNVLSLLHNHVCRVINDISALHDPTLLVMSGHPRITLGCRVIDDIPALHDPIQWIMSGYPDTTMECRVIDDILMTYHTFVFHSVPNWIWSPVHRHYQTTLRRRNSLCVMGNQRWTNASGEIS